MQKMAHSHNLCFGTIAFVMQLTEGINPHLVAVIVNPVGTLPDLPMMNQLAKKIGLLKPFLVGCFAFGEACQKRARQV